MFSGHEFCELDPKDTTRALVENLPTRLRGIRVRAPVPPHLAEQGGIETEELDNQPKRVASKATRFLVSYTMDMHKEWHA